MKLIPTLELPPEAGDIDISMFKDAFGKIPATVKLGTLLEAVASGRWRDQVQDLRNLLHSGNRETYDARKRLLPAVTLSGLFRDRTELVQHSGLLQGDFDKLQNPEEIRNALGKDQYIIASFLSPSTEGVKAVVWVPADPGRHIEIFKAAERYFKECYGLEMDQSCKDTNRLCFVSLDPQICSNSAATVQGRKNEITKLVVPARI